MLVMALWCLTDAAELAATQVATQEAWFLVRDALALPAVTVSLWFALEYAGLERWLTRPVVALLGGAVVLIMPLYLVDGGRLLWSRLWLDGTVRGDLAPVGAAFGLYGYVVALLASAILVYLFVRSPGHRVPVALILLGQVGVRVAYPLGALNVAGVPNLASMALAVDFASSMYVVALFGFRLFDLVPLARLTILERMPEAMLVLDAHDRVADLNDAASQMLGLKRNRACGQPLTTALSGFSDLVRRIGEVTPEAPGEASITTATGTRSCEVTSTFLTDWQERPIGRLVLLHDISALRRVEAQLVKQERALAAAAERERLARELHDGLAQDLWLAKLKATRLAGQPGLDPETRALSDEVTAAVDAGLVEARQVVAAMRSTNQANGHLRGLLSRSLQDFEDRFGLSVEFDCDGELPMLAPRAEAETLRIMGEALTNVRRHADATVVRVRGGLDDGELVLEVRDNGCGFEPDTVGAGVYGLAGMRERATQIGAEFEIESAPRQGTCVRLRVPLSTTLATEAGVP